ncbi:MAG: bdh [Chloroflexi bacterium]|nr:bdh [Chloroflexota bacterium]MDB5075370.1 bdh [Chloroflexota bacterium]
MNTPSDAVALVTGGGGGLGEVLCYVLADAGITVAVADIREAAAEAIARSLVAADREAVGLGLDITDEAQAADAIDAVIARFGRLDFLINCAGVDVTQPIAELTSGDWDHILAVNLRGPFLMSKYALSAMRAQGRGHIVNVVSTAAKRAWANAAAYHASKWGLLGFTYALHVEGRAQNIKVTAVINGGMRTPFLLDRFSDIDPSALQDPRNVAETILFVLSGPEETVIPEILVIPMRETSWP